MTTVTAPPPARPAGQPHATPSSPVPPRFPPRVAPGPPPLAQAAPVALATAPTDRAHLSQRLAGLPRAAPVAGPLRAPALAAALLTACPGTQGPAPSDPPVEARRIASQVILADEVLWALGPAARARVVGVSTLADDPRYSSVAGLWPASVARRALTAEGILALDPDLAVIASFTAPEVRALLGARGVRTITFGSFAGFADYRAHVRVLAAAAADPAAGERLIADFDARIAALAAAPPARSLAAVAWGEGHVAGAGTTFDDEIRAAGHRNLAAEQGLSGHVPLSLESLVSWDPEVLVVLCPAAAPDDPACAEAERGAAALPGLAATRALREARVVAIPGRALASTGADMASAAEILHHRLAADPR